MIDIIFNILTKRNSYDNRTNYGIACGVLGIILNILLFVAKIVIGVLTNSLAIMADAFNNLSDSATSLITIISFIFSQKKPDAVHPYGHGRYEYISSLIISFGVLLIAFQFITEAIKKIFDPQTMDYSLTYIVVLVFAILIKIYMTYYNFATAKKISSLTIKATAYDSMADAITTTIILLSLLVYHYFHFNIDGYSSIFVSMLILKNGYQTSKETINHLVGKAPDITLTTKITDMVKEHPLILDMHDLIIHDYGFDKLMASLHVEVDANNDLLLIHDQINEIEEDIKDELNCQITIHIDPIVIDDARINLLKIIISDELSRYQCALSYHDLRIIKKDNKNTVYFDVIIPYDCDIVESLLIDDLTALINKNEPNLNVYITIDHY